MTPFYQNYFNKAWEMMMMGQENRKSHFRTAAFSTQSEQFPELRTVVIRKVDQDTRSIFFHTDVRSEKINELKSNPRCCLLFYSKPEAVQIRVYAQAKLHINNNMSKKRWTEMALLSKRCYLAQAPGSKLDEHENEHAEYLESREPKAEECVAGYANFAVVECDVKKIDYLDLNFSGHTRIVFNCSQKEILAQKVAP